MTRIHVDEVFPKGSTYPLLINFLNGQPSEQFGKQECLLLNNEQTDLKSLVTQIDEIVYAGDEEKDELSKTFIVRRNKQTGKVRVLEAGVVNLVPHLNIGVDKPLLDESSNLELSRKFGSKKHKKVMEQREKLKVNVETVQEQMLNATHNINEDTLNLSSYNTGDSDDFYVPIIDRNADKVEDVYNVNLILTKQQFDKIYSEIEEKDFVADLSAWIRDLLDKKLSKNHTVLALYADCLFKLYSTTAREITKKNFTICPYSSTLNDIIVSNFTSSSNGRRTRPGPYKDKSLCHAIVFLLLINNYKFEMEKFCDVAKLSPNTASLKMRVTGATVSTVNGKKVVQLKLPLQTKASFRRKSAKF